MHYAAIHDGEEREVEIIEVSPGRYTIRMNGRELEVDVHAVSETTLSFILNNHAYNIEFESNPGGGENLLIRGHVLHVEVLDLRKMRLRKVEAAHGGPDGPVRITSPMPGKVVSVLVAEGEEVEEGQGLVVIEAMKMENELRAPRAGVVQELTAQEGQAVDGGATLCVIV